MIETLAICQAGRTTTVFAAKGPGRGYCREGGYLRRRYPPLLECGILEDFLGEIRRAKGPAAAILLDAGNDLLHGAAAAEIQQAVLAIGHRLLAAGVGLTLVLPPVLPVLTLRPLAFRVLRSIMFPGRSVSLEAVQHGIVDLADGLTRLRESGARIDGSFAGLVGRDRIHVACAHVGIAAGQLAKALLETIPGAPPPVRLMAARVLRAFLRQGRLAPLRMTVGGRLRETQGRYQLLPELELRLY